MDILFRKDGAVNVLMSKDQFKTLGLILDRAATLDGNEDEVVSFFTDSENWGFEITLEIAELTEKMIADLHEAYASHGYNTEVISRIISDCALDIQASERRSRVAP